MHILYHFHKSCQLRDQEIFRLLSVQAETQTQFLTKSLQSVQPYSNTSLDNLIQIGPTNHGRAYTRGDDGGQSGNFYYESPNSG